MAVWPVRFSPKPGRWDLTHCVECHLPLDIRSPDDVEDGVLLLFGQCEWCCLIYVLDAMVVDEEARRKTLGLD